MLGPWGAAAHAPVVIQSALPCRCAYVLRHSDGSTAAWGVLDPGVSTHVTSADPRLPLSLGLTPLSADGEPAGVCLAPLPLTGQRGAGGAGGGGGGGAPVQRELCVSPTVGGEAGGVIRLSVVCEPACAAAPGGGPPPLLVDVRAPLLLANGCPFAICAAATASTSTMAVEPGREVIENKYSTDVESTNRARASV